MKSSFPGPEVLNGHGGNVTALSNITQELSDQLGIDVLAMTYFTAGAVETAIKAELEAQDSGPLKRRDCRGGILPRREFPGSSE